MKLLLVGTHFAKPGRALLEYLPNGSEVQLVREPENPYDANAILVLVGVDQLLIEDKESLEAELEAFGFTLAEVMGQTNWPIGHVGASGGKPLERALRAGLEVEGGGELLAFCSDPELPAGWLSSEGDFYTIEIEIGAASDA